jgi:hypothetical protein
MKKPLLEVDFADFAIATLIFDSVFVESLHRNEGSAFETRQAVESISSRHGRPAQARDLARELNVSTDTAYRRLREAEEAGTIRRVNPSEKSNRKFFLAAPRMRFIPDPEKLFQQLKQIPSPVRFVHPLTGKRVVYTRRGRGERA